MAESVCGQAGWDVLCSPLLLWLYCHLQEAEGQLDLQLKHKVLMINTVCIALYHLLLQSYSVATSIIIVHAYSSLSPLFSCICVSEHVLFHHLRLLLAQTHLHYLLHVLFSKSFEFFLIIACLDLGH